MQEPAQPTAGVEQRRVGPESIDLPMVLMACAILEVVLNRWGTRLFFAGPFGKLTEAARVLDLLGRFAFHTMVLLAFAALCYVGIAFVWRRDLFPFGVRLVFLAALGACLPVAAALLVTRNASPGMALHVQVSAGIVALLALIGVVIGRTDPRARAGAMCLALPILLGLYAQVAFTYPWSVPLGDVSKLPARMLRLGESSAVAAALMSFVAFMPAERAQRLGGRGPLLLAATVTLGAAVVSVVHFDTAFRASTFALGLTLPKTLVLRSLYLAALFALAVTVLALLAESSRDRARGVGLLLFVLAGYELNQPLYSLLLATGATTLALATAMPRGGVLAVGASAETPVLLDDATWRAFAGVLQRQAARHLGEGAPPPEAVMVHADEGLVIRLRCLWRGRTAILRFLSRDGLLHDVDCTLGTPGDSRPILSLAPRKQRLGPEAAAPQIKTGDKTFDSAFVLRGSPLVLDILDESLRKRLLAFQGWMGVWSDGSVRFRDVAPWETWLPSSLVAQEPEAASRVIFELMDTLSDLSARAVR